MSVSHAHDGVSSLLAALVRIPDPRRRRGLRHRLVVVLAVAVIATLAGGRNYRELGSVAADFSQELLRLLGCRWHLLRRRFVAPSAATLRRALIAVDGEALDATIAAWLRAHARCDSQGWAIALDGKDLNGSWTDEGRLVLLSAFTHRRDGQDAITLAQVAVPADTTETTQVAALLDPIDITGALVTCDAAHTCEQTVRYLVEDKNADYLLAIKGNRAGLYAAVVAAGRTLITGEPEHVMTDDDHGRLSTWATWSADVDDSIGLPYAARLAVIRRDVADLAGQPLHKEIACVLTSRPLDAEQISRRTRGHWSIENLEHRPRDTIWREDDHQAYQGNGPRNAATLRNLALGILALNGITKLTETIQKIGRDPMRALPMLTLRHA